VNLPQQNYSGRYVYKQGIPRPIIFNDTSILELESTTANGTVLFDQAPRDFSNSNYLYIVYRNTGSGLTAGDLVVTLTSSVGNSVTLTSQKTAAQGEWVYEIFKFQEDGTTGVSFTGTPVFTSMTTELEVPVSGDVLQVSKLYFGQTQLVFPPIVNSIEISKMCPDVMSKEDNIETFDLICGLDKEDVISTGYNPTFDFTVKTPSLLLDALAYGTTPKSVELSDEETVTKTITSNVASLGSAVGLAQAIKDVKSVTITSLGEALTPSLSGTDLERTEYFLDEATGDITFSTGAFADGTTVEIQIGTVRTTDSRVIKGNDLGTIGNLLIKMVDNGKARIYNYKAKLMPSSTDFANDNSITNTYQVVVLDDNNKKETYGIY
jgi:hypothetical protein